MKRSTMAAALRNLILAVTCVVAAACGGSSTGGTGSGVTGKPGGQCSTEGAKVPAADGCNTCTCTNGSYACTEMACVQDGGSPLACSTPGAKKDAGDGCNTCTCSTTGEWICTRSACNVCQPGQTMANGCGSCVCSPNGQWTCPDCQPPECTPGQTTQQDCNTCSCLGGHWECTYLACSACTEGDTKAVDCNTCSCTGGQWACTKKACPPPVLDAAAPIFDGVAPKFCGARAGDTCASSEYCAYTEGALCGAADAEATCAPRPTACDTVYSPVCGCDGKDYTNSCFAAVAGTGVRSSGACPTGAF